METSNFDILSAIKDFRENPESFQEDFSKIRQYYSKYAHSVGIIKFHLDQYESLKNYNAITKSEKVSFVEGDKIFTNSNWKLSARLLLALQITELYDSQLANVDEDNRDFRLADCDTQHPALLQNL